LAGQPR